MIYREDFKSGDASGWELMEDWAVVSEDDNYFLQGENHGFAILRHEGWEDYRLRFRLLLQHGIIHLNFRHSGTPSHIRYFVAFSEYWMNLQRQGVPDPAYIVPLADTNSTHSLNRWYDVEIVGEGGHIQVFVDGNLELEAWDSDPLLQGTIAFETLDDSSAQIDDVEVLPLRTQN